jgi:hypothetical protein
VNRKILLAGAGIALAGGLLYFARNGKQPPVQQTLGLIKTNRPVIDTICIENIQNLSHRPVNMTGIGDELAVQLQKVGFQARSISNPTDQHCDATVNAEIVEISGRGRKTARLDFRLTLAGEQPPRISTSVEGKSHDNSAQRITSNFKSMSLLASQPADTSSEREAIIAALAEQAHQIDAAYKRGLPPWVAPSE